MPIEPFVLSRVSRNRNSIGNDKKIAIIQIVFYLIYHFCILQDIICRIGPLKLPNLLLNFYIMRAKNEARELYVCA